MNENEELKRLQEKEAKRKEQVRNSVKKFKKVGTNLRLAQYEQVEKHIAESGFSISAYVKNLIEADLYGITKSKIEKLNASVDTITKQRDEAINKMEKLEADLKAERSKTLMEKFFKG